MHQPIKGVFLFHFTFTNWKIRHSWSISFINSSISMLTGFSMKVTWCDIHWIAHEQDAEKWQNHHRLCWKAHWTNTFVKRSKWKILGLLLPLILWLFVQWAKFDWKMTCSSFQLDRLKTSCECFSVFLHFFFKEFSIICEISISKKKFLNLDELILDQISKMCKYRDDKKKIHFSPKKSWNSITRSPIYFSYAVNLSLFQRICTQNAESNKWIRYNNKKLRAKHTMLWKNENANKQQESRFETIQCSTQKTIGIPGKSTQSRFHANTTQTNITQGKKTSSNNNQRKRANKHTWVRYYVAITILYKSTSFDLCVCVGVFILHFISDWLWTLKQSSFRHWCSCSCYCTQTHCIHLFLRSTRWLDEFLYIAHNKMLFFLLLFLLHTPAVKKKSNAYKHDV